jgi:AcrR family transcriptional regulator
MEMGEKTQTKKGRFKKRLPASERKEVILDAAMRTFVEFGYHGALMDTIAERAGITKPILYRHFSGKIALLLALLDRAGADLLRSLKESIDAKASWREFIEHDIKSYLNFVKKYEMPYRLLYAMDTNVDPKVSERINENRELIIELVAKRIESFVDTDALPREDIYIIAVMLVGMTESTAMHWLNNKDAPLSKYQENLIKAVTAMMAQLPPRRG